MQTNRRGTSGTAGKDIKNTKKDHSLSAMGKSQSGEERKSREKECVNIQIREAVNFIKLPRV